MLARLLSPLVIFFVSEYSAAQECAATSRPSDWIFCDDFEAGIDPAWASVDNVSVTTTSVFSGNAALAIMSHKDVDNGGGMMLDLAGEERLHLRFFTQVSENFGYLHHFVQVGGREP